MTSIAAQRCYNHGQREAVARCALCGNFFCRECSTEHDGRMVCARCLIPTIAAAPRGRLVAAALRCMQLLAGVLVLWLFFFLMGRALLRIPTSFHDGTFLDTPGATR